MCLCSGWHSYPHTISSPADYYTRKGWHSILCRGLSTTIDIYVGWPGRVHDARVFSNSSFFRRGQDGSLFPNWTEQISGVDVPIVVLGDPAYPLLRWCMKAFPDTGSLTSQQRCFNYQLSKARVVVEHSYGKLKGRWRCLLDVLCEDVPELVSACCVLHNVCEIHGDEFNAEWLDGVEANTQSANTSNIEGASSSSSEVDAASIRNALVSYFNQ